MDGILIVNKPQGMTSHDVVDFVRRSFGLKKVGHAGTLDPMATGVLVMLLGKLTKSAHTFLTDDKEYEGTITLGARSDTGDAWGSITASGPVGDITNDRILDAFKRFTGDIEQYPPAYSAVKVNGRRLYKLARKGVKVEVAPRKISIRSLEVKDIALPEVSFGLTCSKGTYVRQLAVDIGESLGCGAYLSRLVRTRSGRFTIEEALTVEELKKCGLKEALRV